MIGQIIQFAGSTIPEHFLVCDGSAVSRTTYSDLFAVIGTSYGIGDGSSTFNLPDLIEKVAIGASSGHAVGTTGGELSHLLLSTEIPGHSHSVPAHGHSNDIVLKTPSLSHTISTQPSFTYTKLNSTASTGVSQKSSYSYNGTGNVSMTAATNVAIADHAATACTMSGGVTDCPAMTSGDAGSGDAHNNMMPYIALVYLIQAEPDTPPQPSMVLYNGALPVSAGGAYIAGRR